ncbi:efflux RND transporter periplasmic adaptor subunit [Parasediminibacterium paludis]|uniref:Efflux RND transporter periplasmic adaptor subunit n=1 Tax=Parasediminibacterium paludis TaxID=908966 RepID=A0ABV8PWH1_9BACT
MNHSVFLKSGKYLVVLFFINVGLLSCKSHPENVIAEKEKYIIPDSLQKSMRIDTVSKCPLLNALTLTGSVDFDQDHQVNIYPLVSGNIQDVKVQIGDYVTAGQTLAIIKSSEMAGYSNNLIVAETNLTATKKQLDAAKDLFASGLSSQLEVTAAQANYDQAVAQLQLVKRVLKINGNNTQGDYVVKAPISGFIVQKNITNNTAIRADNGNSIFAISDLKNVWIQANVYESNIGNVHLGDEVNITTLSYPGKIFKGKVDKILNVLDPTNKVMKVRIVLPNTDYSLKPQMFTSVTVLSKENQQAICIPSSALIFDHSQYYVLKYQGKGVADITPVQVLSTLGDKTYLLGGVKEGDIIIASQAILFYDALNN